jgi:two-component system cell cycle sensor histidine kinase/response regulator CckA
MTTNGPPSQAKPLQLLLADDDENDIELCLLELRRSGILFRAETTADRDDFCSKLSKHRFDVVLSDYRMKSWTGMDALDEIRRISPGTPLILLSGTLGDDLAVECIKKGVTDYVLKQRLARLPVALLRAQDERVHQESEVHALASLRESEIHSRTLVENAPEAIVLLDVDKRAFVDCNENAQRMFQYTRDELLRLGPVELSPKFQPDGRASEVATRAFVEQALEGGVPAFEWVHCNSRGEEIPCDVHLVRLPSATRRLVRGSIVDISERKRAETALRDTEARYRDLVNNATYGIYWVSLEGDLLDVNPALVRIMGYDSPASLLALKTSAALFADPTVRDRLFEEFRTRSSSGSAKAEWKRKDGKIIIVQLSGRLAHDPGRKTNCIEVIVEDITERVALEKQLIQAQKFEGIGQLAGGIAHDFNNMIGAILGWADIGLDETQPDSRLHRHFGKIRHQAERAAALTKQLLAFARRQVLEPRDLDLNKSVSETLGLLERVIGSNIEIKTRLPQNLALVRADPTQVEQVVMNLCINARDAMPSGGSIAIETSNVLLDASCRAINPLANPGNYVVLSVTDTGTGMDQVTLDHIFEPFFTTKELGKGTGLGLATVYGIVRQHGGFINVYSEVSVGTTFRMYLPVSASAQASPERTEDVRPARGGTEMILVVEDHEGLRQLANETLTNLGYRILLAADGDEALREFALHRDEIDCALLDVILPKLSGPDIYWRISAEKPGLPVLFATGYGADIASLQKAIEQGLPVIHKPYTPRDLGRRIRECLDAAAVTAQSNAHAPAPTHAD